MAWNPGVPAAVVAGDPRIGASDGAASLSDEELRSAIERVASRLDNTPTICRKCYVHPELIKSYLDGSLLLDAKANAETEMRDEIAGIAPEEAAFLASPRPRLGVRAAARRVFASGRNSAA